MSTYWLLPSETADGLLDLIKHYPEIFWRVSGEAAEVERGDITIFWQRDGDPGIIGVGRVLSTEPDAGDEHQESGLRVRLWVRAVRFVGQSDLDEQFISTRLTGPLATGTGVRLNDDDQIMLGKHLPPTLHDWAEPLAGLPSAGAWDSRRDSCVRLGGPTSDPTASLRALLRYVDIDRPTVDQTVRWAEMAWSQPTAIARESFDFLIGAGLLGTSKDAVVMTNEGRRFFETDERLRLAVALHSQVKLVGELLVLTQEPRSAEQLRSIANQLYGMDLRTSDELLSRLAWLEAAGLVTRSTDGLWLANAEIADPILEEISLYSPRARRRGDNPESVLDSIDYSAGLPARVVTITEDLATAAAMGGRPGWLERTVADAFEFLGFRATWLGETGQVSVIVDAALAAKRSYRALIDVRGRLSQPGFDRSELMKHYGATYVAEISKEDASSSPAVRSGVRTMSLRELSDIVRQHAEVPLGIDHYRILFDGTEAPLDNLARQAAERDRQAQVLGAAHRLVAKHGPDFGALSDRDLLMLATATNELDPSEAQHLTDAVALLAHPMIGVLDVGEYGYTPTTNRQSGAQVLRWLADVLDPKSRD